MVDFESEMRGFKRSYDEIDPDMPDLDSLGHPSEPATIGSSLSLPPGAAFTAPPPPPGTETPPVATTLSMPSSVTLTPGPTQLSTDDHERVNRGTESLFPMPSVTTASSSAVELLSSDALNISTSGSESELEVKAESDTKTEDPDDIHADQDANKVTAGGSNSTDDEKEKKETGDKSELNDQGEDLHAQLKSKRDKQEEERLKMQVLVSNFSDEQLNRYEMFRRAAFPKAAIKRLMQNITGTTIAHNIVIAMSGISKVFVGEVVEAALDVMEKWDESGPLQPKHLREAVRILKSKNGIPNTKYTKKLLR